MKTYPALVVRGIDPDRLAALVDDFGPTAIEPRDQDVRVFFTSARARDAARVALAPRVEVDAVDVSDDDWARRSQENLQPITIGALTVFPSAIDNPEAAILNPHSAVPSPHSAVPNPQSTVPTPQSAVPNPQSAVPNPHSAVLNPHSTVLNPHSTVRNPHSAIASSMLQSAIRNPQSAMPMSIVIRPSMGFGTGHHATTRLCLEALQAIDVRDRALLDVGTGSGVLAIAAVLLGAARATGIDTDADALQSARENLDLNPAARSCVAFAQVDLTDAPLPDADVVTANLTGAMLTRSAGRLAAAVRGNGVLILSGLLAHERDEVYGAFAGMHVVWEREEDGWVGLAVKKS